MRQGATSSGTLSIALSLCNKRIGFTVAVLFLELNGKRFTAPEAEATLMTLALAARELDEPGYADWLRKNSQRAGKEA